MEGYINKYLRVFKMTSLGIERGEEICRILEESTLERLTKVGVDRRIIGPIIDKAIGMDSRANLDERINTIMNDRDSIIRLMGMYCK